MMAARKQTGGATQAKPRTQKKAPREVIEADAKLSRINGEEADEGSLRPEDREFEMRGETFTLREEVSPWVLMKLSLVSDSRTSEMDQTRAFVNFIRAVFIPEDFGRFDELLSFADPTVETKELNDTVVRLVEQVSNRPTEPSN